jgi:hypothetical protein
VTTATALTAFPPFFGVRRALACPPLERIDFAAGDGSALCLHHTSGGERGPVVMTPGTAMTALTYCIDSVPQNIVEYLVALGFDVWLFDWRTSPLLDAHKRPYRLADVARHDWPAALAEVRRRSGKTQLSVLAHCLSSPSFLLSLLRGHVERDGIRAFVASQVALHLRFTTVGTVKLRSRLDWFLPSLDMVHQEPADTTGQFADIAAGALARLLPVKFTCDNRACYRQAATFGELIYHPRINAPTHAMMGELVPECLTAFLEDVAVWGRRDSVMTGEDLRNLERLRLPIHFISGAENRMFVPESTAATYRLLCDANGTALYRRTVYDGFGHLDCYFGESAREAIWPDIAATLGSGGSV